MNEQKRVHSALKGLDEYTVGLATIKNKNGEQDYYLSVALTPKQAYEIAGYFISMGQDRNGVAYIDFNFAGKVKEKLKHILGNAMQVRYFGAKVLQMRNYDGVQIPVTDFDQLCEKQKEILFLVTHTKKLLKTGVTPKVLVTRLVAPSPVMKPVSSLPVTTSPATQPIPPTITRDASNSNVPVNPVAYSVPVFMHSQPEPLVNKPRLVFSGVPSITYLPLVKRPVLQRLIEILPNIQYVALEGYVKKFHGYDYIFHENMDLAVAIHCMKILRGKKVFLKNFSAWELKDYCDFARSLPAGSQIVLTQDMSSDPEALRSLILNLATQCYVTLADGCSPELHALVAEFFSEREALLQACSYEPESPEAVSYQQPVKVLERKSSARPPAQYFPMRMFAVPHSVSHSVPELVVPPAPTNHTPIQPAQPLSVEYIIQGPRSNFSNMFSLPLTHKSGVKASDYEIYGKVKEITGKALNETYVDNTLKLGSRTE